jgi:hypothetical protein
MWVQRLDHVPLATGDADDYRYCLDALIVAIRDMRRIYGVGGTTPPFFARAAIAASVARADDLAGRPFDRYIEDLP